MFFGGAAFRVTRLGGREWGMSIALGVMSIPLGVLIRLMPNEPFVTSFDATTRFGKLLISDLASCLKASCDALTAVIFSSQARAFSLLDIDLGQASADYRFSVKWEEYRSSTADECKVLLSLDIPLIA